MAYFSTGKKLAHTVMNKMPTGLKVMPTGLKVLFHRTESFAHRAKSFEIFNVLSVFTLFRLDNYVNFLFVFFPSWFWCHHFQDIYFHWRQFVLLINLFCCPWFPLDQLYWSHCWLLKFFWVLIVQSFVHCL